MNPELRKSMFLWCGVLFSLVLLLPSLVSIPRSKTLSSKKFEPDGGFAFRVFPGALFGPGDREDEPETSALQLFEDGSPLGVPHTVHALIRKNGSGAYSHWKGELYFSASDGSDPRTNGRAYSARGPVHPPGWVTAIAAVSGALCLLILSGRFLGGREKLRRGISRGASLLLPLLAGAALLLSLLSWTDLFWANREMDKDLLRHRAGQAWEIPFSRFQSPWLLAPPPAYPEKPSFFFLTVNGLKVLQKPTPDHLPGKNGSAWCLQEDSQVVFVAPFGEAPRENGKTWRLHYPLRVRPAVLWVLALAFAGSLIFRKRLASFLEKEFSLAKWLAPLFSSLFAVGAFLLILNISGLFLPLGNPEIRNDPLLDRNYGPLDAILDPREAGKALDPLPGEEGLEYAERANLVVSRALAHYWWDAGVDPYRLRVPPWENWIIFLRSFRDERYLKYEIVDHKRPWPGALGAAGRPP